MQVYTYSEAARNLAVLPEQADENTGKVLIRRKDGLTFALIPEKALASPPDIPSVRADITAEEIVSIVRNGRERHINL
jgi:hypothetical protein